MKFGNETEGLLQRLSEEGEGGAKGQLAQRPQFKGAPKFAQLKKIGKFFYINNGVRKNF
jgi:hypothetical protein